MSTTIDQLTLGELKTLVAALGGTHQAKAHDIGADLIGQRVLIRTYSAGVHFGTLKSRNGTEVVLADARRIWSWTKAFTLSKIAVDGLDSNSKLSEKVAQILLTEAIEVIPVSATADAALTAVRAHAP